MPGFNIMPYGGGYSAQGPSNTAETRGSSKLMLKKAKLCGLSAQLSSTCVLPLFIPRYNFF